jgi:hypothetical protein
MCQSQQTFEKREYHRKHGIRQAPKEFKAFKISTEGNKGNKEGPGKTTRNFHRCGVLQKLGSQK